MPLWVLIFLVITGVLFGIKMLYVAAAGASLTMTGGALFVRTSSVRVDAALNAVPMKPGDRFVDLGCGDGRVLLSARRRYGVDALGFEVNPLAYLIAKLRSAGLSGIKIKWGSFWTRRLDGVDFIFCYLFPDVMERVAFKLESELPRKARVISCNFPLPGWEIDRILRPNGPGNQDPIYLYRLPQAVAGKDGGGVPKERHPRDGRQTH